MSGSCGRFQHFGVSCVGGRLGRGARRRGRWIGRSCLGRRGRWYVLLQRLVCPAVVEVSKSLRRDKSGLECVIRSIDGPTRARHRTAGSRQTCGTVVAAAPYPIYLRTPQPLTLIQLSFFNSPFSSSFLSVGKKFRRWKTYILRTIIQFILQLSKRHPETIVQFLLLFLAPLTQFALVKL